MEYPYLGFKNADGSEKPNSKSCVVFFTSKNQGVVVHGEGFGTNSNFDEDEYLFYPEENTVILQN